MDKPTHCRCGAPLVQRARGRPRRYCSKACERRAWNAGEAKKQRAPHVRLVYKTCDGCGEVLSVHPEGDAPGGRRVCDACVIDRRKAYERLRRQRQGKHARECPCGATFYVRAPSAAKTFCASDCLARSAAYGPHLAELLGRCGWCDVVLTTRLRSFCSDRCARIVEGLRRYGDSREIEFVACRECGKSFSRARGGAKEFCSVAHEKRAVRRKNKALRRTVERDGDYITTHELGMRDGWKCGICGGAVPNRKFANRPNDPTTDHIIPVSQGGLHVWENVRLAHKKCNEDRGVGGHAQLRLIA